MNEHKELEGMLLTPEEWNEAAERGVKKWTDQLDSGNPTSFSSSAPFVHEEVCLAQVRKVVMEWIGPRRCHVKVTRLCQDSQGIWEDNIGRLSGYYLTAEDWQALCAAGGE